MHVTTLWIYGELSTLCRVSLASYLHHGMQVSLYTYNRELVAPEGVNVRDAREIMPESEIDKYRFQPGGKLPLVSDRWHYLAAHKMGGWQGHLDTTLLKSLAPLDSQPYVFGPHHRTGISMALWKAPSDSPLTRYCIDYQWTLPPTDWHAGMYPIAEAVERYDLWAYIVNYKPSVEHGIHNRKLAKRLCDDDSTFKDLKQCALREFHPAAVNFWMRDNGFYAIHWCNGGQPADLFDTAESGSFIDQLKKRYGVQ